MTKENPMGTAARAAERSPLSEGTFRIDSDVFNSLNAHSSVRAETSKTIDQLNSLSGVAISEANTPKLHEAVQVVEAANKQYHEKVAAVLAAIEDMKKADMQLQAAGKTALETLGRLSIKQS